MIFNFDKFLPQYEINTPKRRAAFMAQCHHESEGFTVIEENLNYSSHALLVTWPEHFTFEQSRDYARQPVKIANRAYANRNGNGDEASGDGWMFRGRGLIQTTGRSNYAAFAAFKGLSLLDATTYLSTADGAIESALFFWKTHRLNAYADVEDIKGMTKIINGGYNGLTERETLYHQYLAEYSK